MGAWLASSRYFCFLRGGDYAVMNCLVVCRANGLCVTHRPSHMTKICSKAKIISYSV